MTHRREHGVRAELAFELRGASKRYGRTLALDDVSLSLERGKVLGLVGANGAGKTTLLSLLAGFARPSAGRVRVLGRTPCAGPDVGALAQRSALPRRESVGGFLLYLARLQGLAQPEQAVRSALARVGVEHTWTVRCGELSYGLEKRVALAQALLGEPPLLLLDEPTSGVDAGSAADIYRALRDYAGSIVLASHNLPQIEGLCDEVAMLDAGRLVEQLGMTQVRARSHVQIRLSHWQLPDAAIAALKLSFELQLSEESCSLRISPKAGASAATSDALRILVEHDVPVTGVQEIGQLQQHLDARTSAQPVRAHASL